MSKIRKQLVFIGLSGGVDSAVAAGLLKKAGYQVRGIFLKCWQSQEPSSYNTWEKDEQDARNVATKLNIPFESWDFTKEYFNRVTKYFLKGYQAGITPNPSPN